MPVSSHMDVNVWLGIVPKLSGSAIGKLSSMALDSGISAELSQTAKITIEDNDNQIFISIASLWEISIKTALGKLQIKDEYETVLTDAVENDIVIHQFVLDEQGHYQLKNMFTDGFATPSLFPDLAIELAEVFETWAEE
ncbi:MAG: hypothetical protein HOP02_08830 [Methylococcaceae bacterium]|nr:hypothetical protein [Methylococcaceae bacterium]